jgi:DNA-binding FadR family transcriptional regulator
MAMEPSFPERQKRADQIASELEAQILGGGWQIGERIGNEAELARKNAVSRWTMREAIAILEQAGTVEARRGPNGGLYVASPPNDLARNNLTAYLEFGQMPFEDVLEVRLALSMASAEHLVMTMRDSDRIRLLRLILAAEGTGVRAIEAVSQARIHMRELTGSGSISLFLGALSDVGMHACWMSSLDDNTFIHLIDEWTIATRQHCLAVAAADLGVARAAEISATEILGELHEASSASGRFRSTPNSIDRAYALYPSARPAKKAERIAWAIRQRISDEHLEPGAIIGSEEFLMRHYQVGRPVLREAIRMLERLRIAEMRRGGASGLTVVAPDPSRIVELAQEHLKTASATPDEHRITTAALERLGPRNSVAHLMLQILADDA